MFIIQYLIKARGLQNNADFLYKQWPLKRDKALFAP